MFNLLEAVQVYKKDVDTFTVNYKNVSTINRPVFFSLTASLSVSPFRLAQWRQA